MGFQFFGDTLGYACGKYFYKYERTNSIVQTSSEIPDGFELVQNFPNPFNPSTKINYRLQVAGVTRLVVIDLMGREVAELVNEYHSPGSYEYKFDASNLSSGVYYYKITAGEFVSVKKMLLVK
ncbi:MAG: T9SS type A sorting domain-containing protein [Ignavibacteria bacterium]|nr:T9SS type A sorting domain-containing protein [Ignavibacteria bacterium]